MSTTLLIADESEIVRAGLKSMVAGSGIKIVAETSTGKEAVLLTRKHKPDVAMLGVSMPDGDGLNSLGRIKLDRPEQNVLMFSTFDNPAYIARAVALDANGWILKTATREQLLEAIRTAADGESTWTREEMRRMSGALATPRLSSDDGEVSLTKREGEVLRQLAYGLTNKEIAQALHIRYETVREHVQHILRKVGRRVGPPASCHLGHKKGACVGSPMTPKLPWVCPSGGSFCALPLTKIDDPAEQSEAWAEANPPDTAKRSQALWGDPG